MNRFREFFYKKTYGQGIWKWDHYFDIYERHFNKFKNGRVNILEIGVYSGGSLEMWRDYFGTRADIFGVDIQSECKIYENSYTKIFIGDQSDIKFWEEFKKQAPQMHIVIDDGSHKPNHQRTTFDCLFWQWLNGNGIYLCEDIHGYPERVEQVFMKSIYKEEMSSLHYHTGFKKNPDNNDRRLVKDNLNPAQQIIKGIYTYPYVIVVEKNAESIKEFIAPKMGTEWAPFIP